MSRRPLVACVLAGLLVASPASSAPPERESKDENAEATRLYHEGIRHYEVMEYDEAIAAFKSAYVLTASPELLFDIAQAYRKKGPAACATALELYRRYLNAGPPPEKRARAEALAAEMDRCAGPAPPAPPPRPEGGPAPAAERPRAIEHDGSRRAPPAWVPWVLAGVGATTAAGGGLLVYSVDRDTACRPRCAPAEVDDMRTRATAGDAMLIGGGLAFVAAVVLWIYRAN